jgi:PERQ amino acid-rich with GYF domain-containing protein
VGATPGNSRPATRRRDTSDAGASGNPFATGTPPQISRRRTDLRDGDEGGSPVRERTFFGRWGTNPNTGEDELKEKEETSGGTIGRNTGLFRRGSGAAWGGTGSGSALSSPMGTFGGAFGGGPMGGFALQSGDKAKPKGNSTAPPKVEHVGECEEEDNESQKPPSESHETDDHQRPMTSDTDPFGVGGSSREEQHSQPSSGIMEQQRAKSSPFGPGAGITISTSGSQRIGSAIGTPTKVRGDLAFSAFGSREGLGGMGSLGMSGLHHQLQNLTFNQQGQVPLRRSREGSIGNALAGDNEPLSPAETNPFTSPPPEKVDDDGMMNDHNEGGGLGSVIAGLRRGETQMGAPGSDRSGRSSTAGLGSVGGGLAGFGGLSGPSLWGSGGQSSTPGIGAAGTPGSFFGGVGLGDLSSPGGLGGASLMSGGLAGLGGSSHFGSASRASRLGQLFPENQHQDEGPGAFESDGFGGDSRFSAFGSRRGFGSITDSPMRERGDVADLFGFPPARSLSNLAGAAAQQETNITREREDSLLQQAYQQESASALGSNVPTSGAGPLRPPGGTLPQQQTHVTVMPDKIQWVYRDPSGVIQGPFNGLEMHEWYRAGFFTPDLAVKRQEDTEFEQLGNLVRKIGNTREPFLVPLPGTSAAAGMSTNAATNWSGSWLNEMPGAQQAVQTPGSIQPPFAGSFPTFGTTLTAEQQNALERRKQEEQYLMAKQREFLLQQQMMAKQAAVAQQLHHQSSAQSLHSQPSFGSLHSPSGFAPSVAPTAAAASAIIGGQNAFEPGLLLRQAGAAAGVTSLDGQTGFPQQFQPPVSQIQQVQDQALLMQQQQQQQQQQAKLAEQQRLQLQKSYQNQQNQQAEKQAFQQAQEQAQQVAAQFQQLQVDERAEERLQETQAVPEPALEAEQAQPKREPTPAPKPKTPAPESVPVSVPKPEPKTASPAPVKQAQPAWGGHHAQPAPLVQPFPPPPGQEPSPSTEAPSAPSIAPWAKETETPKNMPSLKEIQEIEAKAAAAREAAEAEARRQMLSQQAANQPPPPAPGLPSTATWATSPSTTPAGGMSAWNKPLAKATPVAAGRKTLQQIQKEEEARKAKAAAAAASQAALNSSNPMVAAAGKRYADLASKAAAAAPQNSAWTTVGPGGKSKTTTPVPGVTTPTVPATTLRASTSITGFVATPAKKPATPVAPAKPAATSAQEEFMKWCRASIKGLNSGVSRQYPLPPRRPLSIH